MHCKCVPLELQTTQYPQYRSEHMLTHVMSTEIIRNQLLVTGLQTYVPLTILPLTSQHIDHASSGITRRPPRRVNVHSAVFSDKSSFYLHACDGHLCMHLPRCIYPWHKGPNPRIIVGGSNKLQTYLNFRICNGNIKQCYVYPEYC